MTATAGGAVDLAWVRRTAPPERRRIRQAAALPRAMLARDCGVSVWTVTAWESGTRRPTGVAGAAYGSLLRQLDTMTREQP